MKNWTPSIAAEVRAPAATHTHQRTRGSARLANSVDGRSMRKLSKPSNCSGVACTPADHARLQIATTSRFTVHPSATNTSQPMDRASTGRGANAHHRTFGAPVTRAGQPSSPRCAAWYSCIESSANAAESSARPSGSTSTTDWLPTMPVPLVGA